MNKLSLLLPLLALLATGLAPASLATPIDPKLAFAFSENANWINFAPTHGGVDIEAVSGVGPAQPLDTNR